MFKRWVLRHDHFKAIEGVSTDEWIWASKEFFITKRAAERRAKELVLLYPTSSLTTTLYRNR